jgi:integrase/recombinase XerD
MEIIRASESWVLDLKVRRIRERTIETYLLAVRQLADWCKEQGVTDIGDVTRHHIRAFITEMIETRSPATANQRYRSLKGFFSWLVDEDEIETSPMAGLKPPKVEERPVGVVGERSFDLMIKAAGVRDRGPGLPVPRRG